MANSESLLELAQHLGKRITDQVPGGSDRERIAYAYRICFARSPTDAEVDRLAIYSERCRTRFKADAKVWAAVARVLMNLDEFVTRE